MTCQSFTHRDRLAALVLACAFAVTACDRAASSSSTGQHDHGHTHGTPASSDLLTISPAVERNLGITYARVERRAVTGGGELGIL